MLPPLLRSLSTSSLAARGIASAAVVGAALTAVHAIREHGGGGAGEPLGALAAVLTCMGRFAAPALASSLGYGSRSELWAIAGGCLPPVLMSLVLHVKN